MKSDDIKSIHIKECWPYEYVKPDSVATPRLDKNAKERARYHRKKAATVKTTDGKKLLKLRVFEMSDSICERLNNA